MSAPFLRLDDAMKDSNLIGFPLALYYYLYHELLNPRDYKPVKEEAAAARLKMSTATVGRAMKLLVELEYVEKGPVRPGEPRTYRLALRRMPEDLRDTA